MNDFETAPDFWITHVDAINDFLRGLENAEHFDVGRSAGGREILAVAYGEREPLVDRRSISLSSSYAAGSYRSYYGEQERSKPVVVLQCAIHGIEIESTVAVLNLLNVLEHGKDLRGRRWDALRDAAQRMRVIAIPMSNPDGRARVKPCHIIGMDRQELNYWTFGQWKSGEIIGWTESKQYFPMPVENMSFLGGYFNDNGANLHHDRFLSTHRQPETDATFDLFEKEVPDFVMLGHTNGGSLMSLLSLFMPESFRQYFAQMDGAIADCVARAGMRGPLWRRSVNHQANSAFCHDAAIYHLCGAMAAVFEFPGGIATIKDGPHTHEEILDLSLTALEAMFCFIDRYGPKPALHAGSPRYHNHVWAELK